MPARGRQLLSQIIAESATKASFGFDEPPVGAPVAVLRRAFGTDAGEVIQVLETDLMSRGISSANEDRRFPSKADQARRRGVHHAFAILVEEFDTYLGQPLGDDVQTVRQMLVILQAEQMGAVPDRSWLTRGLSSPNDIIAVRAVKAVGALGDRDYAESVLTDLVLSDRSDVADAARDVLRAMREDDLPPIPAARAQMMDVHDLPTDVGQAAS